MRRILAVIPAVCGTYSPAEQDFLFDFVNTDNTDSPSGFQWSEFTELSGQDIAWLEFGFGQDMWNYLPREISPVIETEEEVDVSTSTTVAPTTTLQSPSKRGRGRPPKSPAKAVATHKPLRLPKTHAPNNRDGAI